VVIKFRTVAEMVKASEAGTFFGQGRREAQKCSYNFSVAQKTTENKFDFKFLIIVQFRGEHKHFLTNEDQ